jgi:plastocyanin
LEGSGTNGRYTYPDDDPNAYGGGPPKNVWTVPGQGYLVKTFGHLHPGGLQDDLSLVRDGKTAHLFSSTAHYYEPAGAVSWDVSITATPDDWRVAVQPGDVLRITTTYDTSRASWYESMGLAVVWMADGPGGVDPFTTRVDQPGKLTHGHLAENTNHGGKATTVSDPSTDKGAATSNVDITDFVYGSGDLSSGKPIPTVTAGQPLTFNNVDAPTIGVWHSITACKAPCTKSTGIAYPLANASVQFDSGQLGVAGPPTANRLTWTTPTNLPPGTYTYFCRIHPFMRGAFRVVSAPGPSP